MSKRTDLERQLADCVRAEEALNAVVAGLSGNPANSVKAKLWDEIAPLVKLAVEERIKGTIWDEKAFQRELATRVLNVLCGPDIRTHLEKL